MDVCEQRMLDEFAQNMFDGEMRFLYVLGVWARDRYGRVGHIRQRAAFARDGDGAHRDCPRGKEGLNHVGGIAAGANADQEIAGISNRLDLAFEDDVRIRSRFRLP